jgi:hypothetical protein
VRARRVPPQSEPEPVRNGRLVVGICLCIVGAFALFLTALFAFDKPDENSWQADDLFDFEPWYCVFPFLVLAVGAVLVVVEARAPKRTPTA